MRYAFSHLRRKLYKVKIERFVTQTIEVETIEGLEPLRQSTKPKAMQSAKQR